MSAWDEVFEGEGALPAALRERVDDLTRRLAEAEAMLAALDASYVRHQGQNEDDLRHAKDATEAVRRELDNHLGDHFRDRR